MDVMYYRSLSSSSPCLPNIPEVDYRNQAVNVFEKCWIYNSPSDGIAFYSYWMGTQIENEMNDKAKNLMCFSLVKKVPLEVIVHIIYTNWMLYAAVLFKYIEIFTSKLNPNRPFPKSSGCYSLQ